MKVLLDEHFSPAVARLLRERGLDADAVVARSDLAEASDREVLVCATREGRAVVTNNVKDFRPIAAGRLADGRGHAGLILVPGPRRRRRGDTGRLADAIGAVMADHPGGIPGSERWVAPER
ncbi:MAG TPA: DUF5615 family PIN-like protein [Solirubrobacteraceae bacterium]|nr:DUF5615 family PIN-like protein [Solirubrobacteraceae bacterium]